MLGRRPSYPLPKHNPNVGTLSRVPCDFKDASRKNMLPRAIQHKHPILGWFIHSAMFPTRVEPTTKDVGTQTDATTVYVYI